MGYDVKALYYPWSAMGQWSGQSVGYIGAQLDAVRACSFVPVKLSYCVHPIPMLF